MLAVSICMKLTIPLPRHPVLPLTVADLEGQLPLDQPQPTLVVSFHSSQKLTSLLFASERIYLHYMVALMSCRGLGGVDNGLHALDRPFHLTFASTSTFRHLAFLAFLDHTFRPHRPRLSQ